MMRKEGNFVWRRLFFREETICTNLFTLSREFPPAKKKEDSIGNSKDGREQLKK